jgi:predicted lipid-binding transport protein (Tim44 family)
MNGTHFSKRFAHATLLGLIVALATMSAVRAADTASEDPAALATQYAKQAADLRASAERHAQLAKRHDAGTMGGPKTAHESISRHCEKIAESLSKAADESDAVAATYRELAGKKN